MFIFFLRYKLIVLILAPQNLSRDVNDWMLQITRFFCYDCSYSAAKKLHFKLASHISGDQFETNHAACTN